MVIIKFSVKGQFVKLETDLRKIKVTSDTINYFKCKFTFDKSWDGFEKRVYFKNASFNITKPAILDDSGCCYIPWEVIAHTGVVLCNVTGIKFVDEEPIRLTAGPARMFFRRHEDKPCHKKPVDPLHVFCQQQEGTILPENESQPTPTEFEQYVAKIEKYIDDLDLFSGDYKDLINKPSIEDVVLIDNKTFPELTLVDITNEEMENILL